MAAGEVPRPLNTAIDERLSPAEVSALREGAATHPYATLALLYLLQGTPAMRDGSLYLESIPTATLTSFLAHSAGRGAIWTLLGTLQWTPYSSGQFFVEVSWSVRPMTPGTTVVAFRTQLLSGTGAFTHPPLEPATDVLLRNSDVWFLAPALHP